MELLGKEDVEGAPAWKIRVDVDGDSDEIWYLDAATFLELKRINRTFDVFSGPGIELEMETFYMDFREVGDVIVPFRQERHFGTRYRVFAAESVQVNPDIHKDLFAVPPAPEPADEAGEAGDAPEAEPGDEEG